MGDRFLLTGLRCDYCGQEQEEVAYAESSGITTHRCDHCKKVNDVVMDFTLHKI
jgi:phage FluMu protein Com